jgi:hypothetical protein
MQIQFDDIGSGKPLLWQRGEEQLVDNARTRETNRALLCAGWMGGHNHATLHVLRPHWHFWAVIETAHDLTFRTVLELIRGQVQTCLDERVVEYRVLLSAGHVGETSQVCQHGPGAILSVESQQSTRLWDLVHCEVTRNRRKSLVQLCAVATVALAAKRAEPLGTVGLTDDGASTHDLAALAPPVAGGTDIIQPAKGRGEFFCLGQGALAGRLTRAIDIKDHPCVSCSIHQTPDFPGWRLIRERAAEQIIEKERAQGFDWRLGQRRQKAREGRAFPKAWEQALQVVAQTDRATLESQRKFYEEVYKPRRDDLAKAWSELSKQAR